MVSQRTQLLVLSLLAAGLTACDDAELGTAHAALRGPAPSEPPRREVLDVGDVDGLSGLTTDGDGVRWAAPEEDRSLVRLSHRSERLPVEGIPDGVDVESVAWLDGDRFALGTEGLDAPRSTDRIFVVGRRGDRFRVSDVIPVPADAFGVPQDENEGIEGLCHVDGTLLAAFETCRERGDRRYALVARRSLDGPAWTGFQVALTSETGKLSALHCTDAGEALQVLAVERHFEVMRIVRFSIPKRGDGGGRPVQADVILDLTESLEGEPNLEGITVDGEDLVLLVDNHYGRRTGPNVLYRVGHASAVSASP